MPLKRKLPRQKASHDGLAKSFLDQGAERSDVVVPHED
jgi:hypothetical protein